MSLQHSKRIDSLGRIVIPKEIRKQLSITQYDEINISLKDNIIQLERTYPTFDAEKCIRNFILVYFGNQYIDILISKEMCSKFFELVFDFVETEVLKEYINCSTE